VVLVNSEWSKTALQKQGVSEEKIAVVPCAYEPPDRVQLEPPRRQGALRVLWVGTVGLRKGIQCLVQAAVLLKDTDVEFTIAGSVNITKHAQRKAPDTMTFLGRVPRDHMSTLYRRADIFVLPTLSDGFALAQLEAMAHGLPVITTRRCGRVVTDREEGLIVEPRSGESVANALRTCDDDRSLVRDMAERARARASQFSLDQYAGRLDNALPNSVTGG
jgi:glycosyltransferase involved in cell wall biosynthesis